MKEWDTPTVPSAESDDDAATPSRLGRFEISRRLGAGGMGLVFEGRDALLDRKVAIKLIHPGVTGHVAPARLLREAQALARLSHPNVVTVYEVGMVVDDPFIAMELVEGETLAEWMQSPRDWRAVLDMFIGLGHGLAAVHALGLVHRDVKPSNVLVDPRGVPKLGDFGLVGAGDDVPDTAPSSISQDSSLTATGSVMGTPAYMAPEQKIGAAVDARADQYAFAKSLAEALGKDAPTKLAPIIARAQEIDPKDRYPSMDALIAALARVRRGNRSTWIAVGATAAVGAVVVGAWLFGRAQEATDPCHAPTERMAAVWSPTRATALAAHLAGIDPQLGAQRFAAMKTVFDTGAQKWLDQNVQACTLTHEGRQSDALLDRRVSCLDRALFEMQQTADLVAAAKDPVTLDEAMRAALALPMLEECADVEALTEKQPQPTSPALRASTDALQREIVDLDVTLRTRGTRDGLKDKVLAAVARARALGHAETLARALRVLALVGHEDEDFAGSVTAAREAIVAASAARDDRVVVELWARMLITLTSAKRVDEAKALLPAGEAAVARITAPLGLSAMFAQARAGVLALLGDFPQAHAVVADTVAKLRAAGAELPGSPLGERLVDILVRDAVFHSYAKEWETMVEKLNALLPLTQRVYGPDHPATSRFYFNLGVGYQVLRRPKDALEAMQTSARIGEARSAPSVRLASSLRSVGTALYQQTRYAEAEPYYRRAYEMVRATNTNPDDLMVASIISDYGAVLNELERYAEARPLLAENLAIYDRVKPPPSPNYARAIENLANVEFKTGNYAAAFPYIERAYAMFVAVGGENDSFDADMLLILRSICQLNLAQYAEAEQTAKQVLAQKTLDPYVQRRARFSLARARAGQGDSSLVPGLREQIKAARAADDEDHAVAIEQWLAEPGGYRDQ